jgi:hypothetical protein
MYQKLKELANSISEAHCSSVQSKAFDQSFINERDILHFFRTLGPQDQNEGILVSVYSDKGYCPKLTQKLINRPPLKSECIEQWCNMIFTEEEFLIKVNFCEILMHEFSEKCYENFNKYINPEILKSRTFKGVDMCIFIGRYQQSPLTLHNDPDKMAIVHFQILGEKNLSIYENSSQILTDSEHVNYYQLNPGDAFAFPGKFYHTAQAHGISASMALGIGRHTIKQYIQCLTSELGNKLNNQLTSNYIFPKDVDALKIDNSLSDFRCSPQLIDELRELLTMKLKSNLYFENPIKRFYLKDDEILKIRKYQLRKPNKIYYQHIDNKLVVSVKGYCFSLNESSHIKSTVDELNEGKSISLKKVMIYRQYELIKHLFELRVFEGQPLT